MSRVYILNNLIKENFEDLVSLIELNKIMIEFGGVLTPPRKAGPTKPTQIGGAIIYDIKFNENLC